MHRLRNLLAKLTARVELMRMKGADGLAEDLEHLQDIASDLADCADGLQAAPAAAVEPMVQAAPGSGRGRLEGRDAVPTVPEANIASTDGAAESDAASSGGVVIGRAYRVLRELGRGGMGEVVLARDRKLGRLVAIKLIDHGVLRGSSAREAFLREARAMARVRHPNVVEVYAFGEHAGTPFFVMEYVPGTTLARLLAVREEALPFDHAMSIIDRACRGLEAIHRAGALHCDVKPANILIGPASRVAVSDLGLARKIGDDGGITGGTPGFVAPEVLREASCRATERADVYAMGALVYRVLTGRHAFDAPTVAEIYQAQLDGRLDAPSAICDLPDVFDPIIAKALSPHPDERYASAEAFRRGLLSAASSLPRRYDGTTILVVDDEEDLLRHTASVVEEQLPGAEVEALADPREAMRLADREPPDIAIVDLDMPVINGIELTAGLRAGQGGGQIDVVMLTGVGSARDWEVLQQLGASGFLLKPVDEAELSSLLRRLAAADL